jgi:hypothetical protein
VINLTLGLLIHIQSPLLTKLLNLLKLLQFGVIRLLTLLHIEDEAREQFRCFQISFVKEIQSLLLSQRGAVETLIIRLLTIGEKGKHGLTNTFDFLVVILSWDVSLEDSEFLSKGLHEALVVVVRAGLVHGVDFFDDEVFDNEKHVRRFGGERFLDCPEFFEFSDFGVGSD